MQKSLCKCEHVFVKINVMSKYINIPWFNTSKDSMFEKIYSRSLLQST